MRLTGLTLDSVSDEPTETRFDGVSLDEVLAGGTGLYEVTTTSGVPVRLHDMSLTRLDHDPDGRTLLVEFLYDDPQWTPDEARQTALAVFAFDGVEVLEQQDEPAERGTPEDALGLVQSFDYHQASGIFALSAFTTYWVFRATGVALTLRATSSE